ncbi:MAG: glycosyltransferase [Desulfobulbaceae bacterium]|nr:glycosyltransferase [Desulfobulbaceae bacterium]
MKVLNVIQLLDPHRGGGTVERTLQMSRHLARQGVECTILTTALGLTAERRRELAGVAVVAFPSLNSRFYLPRFSWRQIRELVGAADVVHLMNHWTLLNALIYREIRRQGKPYVICPAGALPVVGRSRLLKKIYNLVIGKDIVRHADRLIAVAANEVPEYLRYGGSRERVAVIPNGIDRGDFTACDRPGFLARQGLPDRPLILFMGRLNWIKGPDLLLQAFLGLAGKFPQWQLVMVGPDEGLGAELRALVKAAGAEERVFFPGFLRGSEKSCAYHAADLLVIPSRQEAMSIVALEAGICGTPVLLTDQCGFPAVAAVGGGLEVAATVAALQAGLATMLALAPAQRRGMGERLRALVVGEYLWESVVRRFLAIYAELQAAAMGNREAGARLQEKP